MDKEKEMKPQDMWRRNYHVERPELVYTSNVRVQAIPKFYSYEYP